MEAVLLAILAQVPNIVATLAQLRAAGQIQDQAGVDAALEAAADALDEDYAVAQAALGKAAAGEAP